MIRISSHKSTRNTDNGSLLYGMPENTGNQDVQTEPEDGKQKTPLLTFSHERYLSLEKLVLMYKLYYSRFKLMQS